MQRLLLAVEAKARVTGPDGLEKLLRVWLDYNRVAGQAPATNAGRKYTELRRLCESGPVTVWLVATGARWCLRATWEANGITFTANQPPMYRSVESATARGRRVLWSRPYDPSLHSAATRGPAGRCSWPCDEPAVWSTRLGPRPRSRCAEPTIDASRTSTADSSSYPQRKAALCLLLKANRSGPASRLDIHRQDRLSGGLYEDRLAA